MCFASSTLFFGVTVKALDLCIAGLAFDKIKPTLLAVELIMARKGKGRLETSVADGTTDVGALPVELFDQIAEALARKAYVDAHEDLKRRYHEDDDWGAWEQKLSGVEQDVVSFSNFLDHGVVYDEFVYEGGVPHFVNEHEAVRRPGPPAPFPGTRD